MTRFDDSLEFVLKWEGGRVDDPVDRGGRTAYGVIQRTYDRYRMKRGLPVRDVWQIEKQEVKDVYLEGYWIPTFCSRLTPPLDIVTFDSAVNCGPSRAVKWLQMALGMEQGEIDGVVGGHTLLHAQDVAIAHEEVRAAQRLLDLRRLHYDALISKDPTQKKFEKGWDNRVNALAQLTGLQ